MSFKPSKKTLIKLSSAASHSHDKAADSAPSMQPSSSSHGGRSRKSFFSFKPTSKRPLVPPGVVVSQELIHPSRSPPTQPPLFDSNKNNPRHNTHSPPQLPLLPNRSLRSSILFSHQFDLNHLEDSNEEPTHLDPSPTSPISDHPSRPLRPTTRPSSWMMLQDGSYAPSLKAQQVLGAPSNSQLSPESFYHRSPERMPPRVESGSDDDRSSHASAASWNRLPSVPQAQQPSHLQGILAGYQLQAATREISPPKPSPSERPAAGSRPEPKPSHAPPTPSYPSSFPAAPPRGSDYSPLAAFLGRSKPPSPSVCKTSSPPSGNAPGGLLSTFLGSQPSELPQWNRALGPPSLGLTASNPKPSPPRAHQQPQPQAQQPVAPPARLEEPIRLEEQPRRGGTASVKKVLEGPEPPHAPASHPSPTPHPDHLAPSSPRLLDAIDATASERTSVRGVPTADPAPPPVAPSVTSPSAPSPTSTTCSTSSSPLPTASILEKPTPALDSSTSLSDKKQQHDPDRRGLGDLKVAVTVEPYDQAIKCGSRKRSVEKVYLDSSSPHSSTCSDRCSSSVDDAMRKCALDSDLSAALTAPSSTCSRASSACEDALKPAQDREEGEGEARDEISSPADVVRACAPRLRQVAEAHPDRGSRDADKSGVEAVSDEMDEEAEAEEEEPARRRPPAINLEHLLLRHPEILRRVITHLDYYDFYSLSRTTTDFVEELEEDPRLRAIVLRRYLGGLGYRTSGAAGRGGQTGGRLPTVTLGDLTSFYAGLEFESLELIEYSKQALHRRGLDYRTAKMIRASTRAHNKLVAYIRALDLLEPPPLPPPPPSSSSSSPTHLRPPLPLRHAGRSVEPLYRPGKAPVFKVWVPTVDHWMSNEELAECERELWRSQVWSFLKKGDVCWNLAIGDFANEGKLIFDGRFLRDLLFDFDEVGHLPSWLDMLSFPASYFHKVVSSSTAAPVVYLDLSGYGEEVKRHLQLSEDRVEVASPQARYRVKRWVYRSFIHLHHPLPWHGFLVLEVQGTSEHAKDLLDRCAAPAGPKHLTPWRIIREKSRPGKVWIRPVRDDERIN